MYMFSFRKSPKTDYTYSQYSKDRYEISPGVINMPNMSRLSYKRELNSPGMKNILFIINYF